MNEQTATPTEAEQTSPEQTRKAAEVTPKDPDRFARALYDADLADALLVSSAPLEGWGSWAEAHPDAHTAAQARAEAVLKVLGDACEPYRKGRAYREVNGPEMTAPIEVVAKAGWHPWEVHAWAEGWNAASLELQRDALLRVTQQAEGQRREREKDFAQQGAVLVDMQAKLEAASQKIAEVFPVLAHAQGALRLLEKLAPDDEITARLRGVLSAGKIVDVPA